MILTKTEITALLSELALQHGLRIYDVDLPRGRRGTLRVYVYKGVEPANSGVTHGDCASFSKTILDANAVDDLLPGECRLEVSSPGVNRRLSTAEHFRGAVGERVLVKLRETVCVTGVQGDNKQGEKLKTTVRGILTEFKEDKIIVDIENGQVEVSLHSIKSAHVDFPFGSSNVA